MVNKTLPGPDARRAERALALSYAPRDARVGLAAVFALDDALAAILRTTRQPIVGQMRLTWWHSALVALDTAPPPANPVLQALARDVVPRVSGATLAAIIEGWEALLDEPLDAAAMTRFAEARGGGLFAAAAALLGVDAGVMRAAGEGWALADLANHLRAVGDATLARALAAPRLAAEPCRWPARARALGALTLLAREGSPGSPARIARLLWRRATGL